MVKLFSTQLLRYHARPNRAPIGQATETVSRLQRGVLQSKLCFQFGWSMCKAPLVLSLSGGAQLTERAANTESLTLLKLRCSTTPRAETMFLHHMSFQACSSCWPLISSLAFLSWRPLRTREAHGSIRALQTQRTRSTLQDTKTPVNPLKTE